MLILYKPKEIHLVFLNYFALIYDKKITDKQINTLKKKKNI